jgi:ABC-type phosphate/phosphonate transport system substrate-binding protein/rhodanese-related sulfurtransferase
MTPAIRHALGNSAVAAGLFAAAALPAFAALKVSISGEAREEVNTAFFVDRYRSLADYISSASGVALKVSFALDLSRELQRTRSAGYDLIIGPAHVVGTAVRYGYEPVVRLPGDERAVFLVRADAKVTSLEAASGARLGLPPADSLATYLARGELNAKGVRTQSHFSSVREYRFHEAALLALELGQVDIAVVDRALAQQWLVRNKGRILFETRAVPGTGVALLATLDKSVKDRLRTAFLKPGPKAAALRQSAGLDLSKAVPITAADYAYVSTLGYFTPQVLAGATVVTAEQVAELMKKGVPVYDTRVKEEYDDKHIKGAKLVTYNEKSRKEVGFDASQDRFDLAGIVQDKNAPVVFACNGPECWKSYKASLAAIKAGYTQVHWFRGGYPEWRSKGFAVE